MLGELLCYSSDMHVLEKAVMVVVVVVSALGWN